MANDGSGNLYLEVEAWIPTIVDDVALPPDEIRRELPSLFPVVEMLCHIATPKRATGYEAGLIM